MHRIDHATAVANMHGPGKAGFGAGNPTAGLPATRFTPAWASDVQENICRVVERFLGEAALVKGNGEQLADAIEQAIVAAIPEVDLSGYARLTGALNLYLNSQRSTPLPVDYSATVTLDFAARCHFDIAALTGDLFLATPTNLAAGQSGYIHLLQDAIGGRAISYGSAWYCPDGAQSLTATANAKDTLVYYVKAADRIIYNLIKGV